MNETKIEPDTEEVTKESAIAPPPPKKRFMDRRISLPGYFQGRDIITAIFAFVFVYFLTHIIVSPLPVSPEVVGILEAIIRTVSTMAGIAVFIWGEEKYTDTRSYKRKSR